MYAPVFEKQSTGWTVSEQMIKTDTAEPEINYLYPMRYSFLTLMPTLPKMPLFSATEWHHWRQLITLHAASSGASPAQGL